MITHNRCFHGEIRKIFCEYHLISGAMKKEEIRKNIFPASDN